MKELERTNGIGKVDAEAENMQLDSVAIQAEPLTFGNICGIVVNFIITIALFISILAAWIYCLTNYNRGSWSIF